MIGNGLNQVREYCGVDRPSIGLFVYMGTYVIFVFGLLTRTRKKNRNWTGRGVGHVGFGFLCSVLIFFLVWRQRIEIRV